MNWGISSCCSSLPKLLHTFSAPTKQLYEWSCPSVCPYVRPSVRPCIMAAEIKFSEDIRPSHFSTMFSSSYHHENFRRYYQWQTWCPCKRSRSKVKVTEIKTQFSRFWIVILGWIHIWWWNDAHSLIGHKRGALLFFNVIRQISRSHGTKKSSILTQIGHFRTVTPVWINRLLRNDAQSLK